MIRQAQIEDLSVLIPLARKSYAASSRLRVFQPERFLAVWKPLLESGTGVIFLACEGVEIIGAIGGVAYPEDYFDALIAQEFFWFVDPGRKGAGIRLYKAFQGWAEEKHCSEIRMSLLADLMPDKLRRFYQVLGFREIETNYAKRLEGVVN